MWDPEQERAHRKQVGSFYDPEIHDEYRQVKQEDAWKLASKFNIKYKEVTAQCWLHTTLCQPGLLLLSIYYTLSLNYQRSDNTNSDSSASENNKTFAQTDDKFYSSFKPSEHHISTNCSIPTTTKSFNDSIFLLNITRTSLSSNASM